MLSIRRLCVTLVLLSPCFAFADEQASPAPEPTPTSALNQLSFDGPIVLSKYSSLPYGFQQKDIAPPFRLGLKLDPAMNQPANAGLWLNASLGFLQTNVGPILDLGLGWKWKFAQLEKFYVLFGFEITDQELPKNGPINQSQFDATYYGFIGGIGYRDPRWDLCLKIKGVLYTDTPIASNEGIETDVAHDATVITNLTVIYTTDFKMKALVGIDLYSFAKTGIVSKEFAVGLDDHSETRFRVGAAYELSPFEIRAEARFTTGVGDQIENSYRAIFLNDDYVLSPIVLNLGVAWNF